MVGCVLQLCSLDVFALWGWKTCVVCGEVVGGVCTGFHGVWNVCGCVFVCCVLLCRLAVLLLECVLWVWVY